MFKCEIASLQILFSTPATNTPSSFQHGIDISDRDALRIPLIRGDNLPKNEKSFMVINNPLTGVRDFNRSMRFVPLSAFCFQMFFIRGSPLLHVVGVFVFHPPTISLLDIIRHSSKYIAAPLTDVPCANTYSRNREALNVSDTWNSPPGMATQR